MLGRANLVERLLSAEETRFAGGNLEKLAERHELKSQADLVDWLLEILVAVPITDTTRQQLIDTGESARGDRHHRIAEVIYAIATLPEFQLA